MSIQNLPDIGLVPAALLLFTSYLIGVSIYRLYLSPLSKIPGPKLAALTYLYEFYYDAIKGGQMLFHTKALHEQYGPIVRITPNGVHVNDVGFYDTIYAAGGGTKHPRNKVRHLVFHDNSMFDTYDARQHRRRRAAIAAPFSKQSIRALEPAIWAIACDYADRRLGRAAGGTGAVVELKSLWNGLTQEVIGRYCFGADSMKALRGGSDEAQYLGTFDDFPETHMHAWGRMFPRLMDLVQGVPLRVLEGISPRFGKLRRFDEQIRRQIAEVLVREEEEPLVGLRNVFREMRDGKHLPAEDRNEAYYKEEAVSFIGAGTETTAGALTTMSYHVLANPHILSRVREELKTVMPDGGRDKVPTLAELEALPYLVGFAIETVSRGCMRTNNFMSDIDRSNSRKHPSSVWRSRSATSHSTYRGADLRQLPTASRSELSPSIGHNSSSKQTIFSYVKIN